MHHYACSTVSVCVCVYKVILWLCCTRSIFFSLYVFLSTVLPPPTLCIAVCPHLTMHSAHYNCTNTQFKKTKTKNISMLKVLKINPPANWQLMILWTLLLQSFFRQTVQIFHPNDVYRCIPNTVVWQTYVI